MKRADAASSRGSAGAAALAAGAKRRPARCPMHGASTRSGTHRLEIVVVIAVVGSATRIDEAIYEGSKS